MWYKVKKIYVWTTKVRPSWWTPWANTLIYYPLTSNLVDQMGNGNTGTMHWTCTFDSNTGIHVTWKSSNYVTWLSNWINNRNLFTLNVRWKLDSSQNWSYLLWYSTGTGSTQCLNISGWNWEIHWDIRFTDGTTSQSVITYNSNWHNYCFVCSNGTCKAYIDWVLKDTKSTSAYTNNVSTMELWWGWTYWSGRSWDWYIKDFIVETVAWSDAEISDYYNLTKSNYWL